jgi:hypothetical protein
MKLIEQFDELILRCSHHFKRPETFERARALAFSHLITYGRHTISRLICGMNEQHKDWSADYKFFSKREWDADGLFWEILKSCDDHCHWYQDAILMAMDETCRKKTGKKIPGVSTLRDPMSPRFHTNLTPAIRFLQASVIVNPENRIENYRAIPIHLEEAAPAKKPNSNASENVKEQYKKEQKEKRISVRGRQAVLKIRQQVDKLPRGEERLLFNTVDGSFCNRNFLHNPIDRVIHIVRARKDLKLFSPVETSIVNRKGRRRIYGKRLPTPEEIRKDDCYPWQYEQIYAAGKYHDLRFKTLAPVLWQKGTGAQPCRVIIIAPLRYRKTKTSKLLYRNPAYLLVPNVEIPAHVLLQYYFLRWDIEVNHRDEKSLLGLGDAQVRSFESVERNPQFSVFTYSLLLLSSINAYGPKRSDDYLPLPKWRKKDVGRPSTLDILSKFRREIMIAQLQIDLKQKSNEKQKPRRRFKKPRSLIEARKRGFVINVKTERKPLKLPVNILSALLYADS